MGRKYKFKTTPYAHQRRGLIKALKTDHIAFLCEPRTGKSKMTIDWLSALNQMGVIDRAIIVCPNRVMGTWVREFHIHCPRLVNITVWDAKARQAPPPPVNGTYQLHVVLVNFEAFAKPGKKTKSGRQSKASGRFKVRSMVRKWIEGGQTASMVIDESHKIKAPGGRASNMLVNMGPEFRKRAILTGTPVTKAKRAYDVFMQWKFLNPNRFAHLPTVGEFKAHYGRWVDVPMNKARQAPGQPLKTFPKFVGPRNMEELHELMAKDAVIVRREDCFDLPPREDIVQFVDLKGSKKAYDQMADEMIAMLEDGDMAEATIKLVQNLRLSQITSGFVTTDEGDIKRIGFEKHDALRDIMEDQFEKGQHMVVAARWKPDLDLITDMGKELGFETYAIRGKVKRADSDKAIIDFRAAEEPALMVIQPAAASLGIDLSTASTMVWYSHTPSWVDFTQACDRIALSRTSTTFIHLVARHSVDEISLDTLVEDGDVAAAIMDNPHELKGHALAVDEHGRLTNVKTAPRNRR